jgi:hypothetical protein
MRILCLFILAAVWARSAVSLRGVVTDPSGAAVPGANVQLRGPGGEHRVVTGSSGEFAFPAIQAGKYQLRIRAKGFAAVQRSGFSIERPTVFDTQLAIQAGKETITVSEEAGRVNASPNSNGGAVLLGRRQIEALSDDPDELALQLQALAGPAPGPNGGQLYIDGFQGNNLPPKSSIHEVRVNSNPFAPEYDRPGFSRIDVYTKPGSDRFHGQAFAQYNNQYLNSRNPLLAQSTRPPYQARLYGFDFGGPLSVNRASLTAAVERREIGENALILATTPEGAINQALSAPQTRTSVSPRLDLALNSRNTLTARYQDLRIELDNLGAGDFSLPSRAYKQRQSEQVAQISETAVISPRALNETRFQFLRLVSQDSGAAATPAIDVVGAFSTGGSPAGNSASVTNSWELTNISTVTRGHHSFKWGGRARHSMLDDTSFNNFLGTFTFYSLDQYRSGTPAQFSLNAGSPATRVAQSDVGLFAGDDWRVRSNLTVSLGLRYEAQTGIADRADIAPRLGLAWKASGKTVVRAGAGVFYDRIPINAMLNALRYNGVTQQSYLILNPAFFPAIPPVAVLQAESQPQQLRPLYNGIRAARLYQSSVGIERQLDAASKITITWIESRGLHLPDSRNINTPIGGEYPFGDPSIRLLSEDAGISRQSQLVANLNVNRKRVTLFGYYAISYGKDNNEGQPADPYNLREEWGPSTYGDVRHRAVFGSTESLPWKISVSPFLMVNSGIPYNITTGFDPNDTGFPAARPIINGVELPRNSARGPSAVNLAMRASRAWAIGSEGKRSLTLSASTINALNHTNLGPPDGDMSSPYFGQSRTLGGMVVMVHGGGANSYNRKIDVQLRFAF